MNKKQFGVLLGVASVAGLLSGVVSSYFMVGWLIAAQKVPPQAVEQSSHAAKVIQAVRFEVVDEGGKIRAILGLADREPVLTLADRDGKTCVSLKVDTTGAPELSFTSYKGKDPHPLPQLQLSLSSDDGSPL